MKFAFSDLSSRMALGLFAVGLCARSNARSFSSSEGGTSSSIETRLGSIIGTGDRPEYFFGNSTLRNLKDMDNRRLYSAAARQTPWSDSYWPYSRGGIALRYLDASGGNSSDYFANLSAYRATPPEFLVRNGRANVLSPAEKYDLLVGDRSWSLARWNWNRGNSSITDGSVPTWMGICHGWAAASFSSPEPIRTVVVRAPDGTPITFYPGDIRALVSALWAHGKIDYTLIGGRCAQKNPPTDRSGRPLDPKCLDSNPGSWHMAVVNQVGAFGRSLIMDETYDVEVWNYPVFQYQYSYFNPATKAATTDLRKATIRANRYKRDPYKAFRSENAESIVGVQMTVFHGAAQVPTAAEGRRAIQSSVSFTYDLELDARGNIVGGEWISRNHPDFTWIIKPNTRALSVGDSQLSGFGWNGGGPVPFGYTDAAQVSSNRGQPLAAVVEALVRMSAR